jgi:hypothetical protein
MGTLHGQLAMDGLGDGEGRGREATEDGDVNFGKQKLQFGLKENFHF